MREDMHVLSWSIIMYSVLQYLAIMFYISATPISADLALCTELLSCSLSSHQLCTVCICDLGMIWT